MTGSSLRAHEASLYAMEYLQTGARRNTEEVLRAFQRIAEHLQVANTITEPRSAVT